MANHQVVGGFRSTDAIVSIGNWKSAVGVRVGEELSLLVVQDSGTFLLLSISIDDVVVLLSYDSYFLYLAELCTGSCSTSFLCIAEYIAYSISPIIRNTK